MALIYFTVPQVALDGDYKEKMKTMDWLGGFLSLTMTVCLLVSLLDTVQQQWLSF